MRISCGAAGLAPFEVKRSRCYTSSALSGGLAVVMIGGGGSGHYGGGSWRSSTPRPNPNPNPFNSGKAFSDAIAFAALIGPIVSVIVLNFLASFFLAAAIAAPAAVAIACFAVADDKEFEGKGFALGALALSLIAAALITPACFMVHLAPFPLLGWIAEALYVLALISGVWKQLKGFLKFLSLFTAIAVAAALIVLPTPAGAAATSKDEQSWTVKLTAETADHQPVAKAWAQCVSRMKWEEGRTYVMKNGVGALTNKDGKAAFKFNDDMRMKIAICGATRPASDEAPGYKLSSAIVFDPLGAGPDPMDWIMRAITSRPMRGATYPVTVTLTEQTDKRFEVYPDKNASSDETADTNIDAAPERFDETALPAALADAVRTARQAADTARDHAGAAEASETQANGDANTAREWAENAKQAEANAQIGADGYKSYASEAYSYAGQWNGARDGLGVERWTAPSPAEGESYAGGFSAGARSSYGVLIYGAHNREQNGLDRYEGAWNGGRTSGVLYWGNGQSYAGGFSGDGMRAGAGAAHYQSGDVYRGDYQDGDRSGHGAMTYADGESYAGGYSGGSSSGYGVYNFKSGARYEGQWAGGKRDGLGVQWSADGKPARAGVWRGGEFTGAP